MKQALIAGTFVIGGILLALAMLLFLQPIDFSGGTSSASDGTSAAPKVPKNTQQAVNEILESEEIEHFIYLDSCRKYVMKDLLEAADLFEKNKEELRPRALSTIQEAGRKLEKLLMELEEEGRAKDYTLVLEGNLSNEWAEEYERDNTWAYRMSYERALVVYKAWLKDKIDLRKHDIELVITGGGYYGLCPTKNLKAKRFSVQLIPKP